MFGCGGAVDPAVCEVPSGSRVTLVTACGVEQTQLYDLSAWPPPDCEACVTECLAGGMRSTCGCGASTFVLTVQSDLATFEMVGECNPHYTPPPWLPER